MWRRILILIFGLLVAANGFASEGGAKDCQRILSGAKSILQLPPKAEILAIGMLVETIRGLRVLGVADYYWGSHEDIYRILREKYPLKRILWAGEMLIDNPENQVGHGVVVLSVNTSGFYIHFDKTNPEAAREDVNDPELLKASLSLHQPSLTTQFSQYLKYDPEDAHLDPLFRELHRRSHELHREGQYASAGTVRHRFRDILNSISLLYRQLTWPGTDSATHLAAVSRVSAGMINDILSFMESNTRYSMLKQVEQSRFGDGESLRSLRNTESRDQEYFNKIVDLIKNVGPRLSPENLDIEVIELGTASSSASPVTPDIPPSTPGS